jgi:hypothetical protein
MTMKTVAACAIAAALLAGSCSSASDEITVEDPWGRASPMVAASGAFYMTINGGAEDDRLVAAESAACGTVEIHETVMQDDVMKMQHLPDGIEIPAGGAAVLEPGGLHIMCIDKLQDFTAGSTIAVTLEFEKAASQTVEAEIREG